MSRYLRFTSGFLFLFFLFACQKEVSFEQGKKSKGSLQSASGDCSPKTVGGTFKAAQALGDTNFIDVTVTVSEIGTYTIYTDTLNGYYFRATGTFTDTGSKTVRLKGFGTPATAGLNDFSVFYDSSVCNVAVTVLPGGSSGGTGVYTLSGSGSTCLNSSVQGTYTQATALTAANKVTIEVNVTTLGTWSLSTATVTGFSFSGSGTFTTTGVQTITLNATGTPTTAGQQTFTVTAASATCTFNVTVVPNATPPAVFTLQGAPGACGGFAVAGTFTQGTALTSSNTVSVQVNVTTAGLWTVATNTVAGMTFAGTGTFATAGIQTITLNGTGTPSASGAQTFTVTAGTSTCTFIVTVGGTTPPNTDHFPLTANSYWTYNDPSVPGDTLKRINNGAATVSGNIYRTFEEFDNDGISNGSLLFRRAGNDYFEYTEVHNYAILTFDGTVEGDILFLKEGLTTGTTWNSSEYSGAEGGVAKKLRYVFTCTDANATVTINGKTFSNVYKISFKSQVSTNGGTTYTDEGLVWDAFYAQGVGMIYMKGTLGPNSIEWNIRYYQVF